MDAKKFLSDRSRSVPLHPVTVRLVDPADPARLAEAQAVLRFVPERLRLRAEDDAADSLAKLKTAATTERRAAEEAYHFLVQAVRQADAPGSNFFETVDEAKSMLVLDEALRLKSEYERYKSVNFPEILSDEEARKIAEDAKNFCVADLLRSYGFWPILRALPFLAVQSGASLTPGS
jgi:hypothetical protein